MVNNSLGIHMNLKFLIDFLPFSSLLPLLETCSWSYHEQPFAFTQQSSQLKLGSKLVKIKVLSSDSINSILYENGKKHHSLPGWQLTIEIEYNWVE